MTKALPPCALCQDEAREIAGGGPGASPEAGLDYLAAHCEVAVVTLGERGCMVKERSSGEVTAEPACSGVKASVCWGRVGKPA